MSLLREHRDHLVLRHPELEAAVELGERLLVIGGDRHRLPRLRLLGVLGGRLLGIGLREHRPCEAEHRDEHDPAHPMHRSSGDV
jgi:hypothetical protein